MKIASAFARQRFCAARPLRSFGRLLPAALLIVFLQPGALPAQKQPKRTPEARKLPSPEKIVADHLRAVGGKKRLAAIRDSTYEWVVRESPEGRARMMIKAPFSMRTDIILTSGEINVAANARTAWTRGLDVRPGSTFAFEQTRLADGVWLPRFAQINASAKVFLFAGFRLDATREYSDYKRFSTRAGEATLDAPQGRPR